MMLNPLSIVLHSPDIQALVIAATCYPTVKYHFSSSVKVRITDSITNFPKVLFLSPYVFLSREGVWVVFSKIPGIKLAPLTT